MALEGGGEGIATKSSHNSGFTLDCFVTSVLSAGYVFLYVYNEGDSIRISLAW